MKHDTRLDKARLDFMQAASKGYGQGWILRESTSGRGMRLHETSLAGASLSVREAIDRVMYSAEPETDET